MKRLFEVLSDDDDYEESLKGTQVKVSRVLGPASQVSSNGSTGKSNGLPSLDSFAYRGGTANKSQGASSLVMVSDDDGDTLSRGKRRTRKFVINDSSDEEEEEEDVAAGKKKASEPIVVAEEYSEYPTRNGTINLISSDEVIARALQEEEDDLAVLDAVNPVEEEVIPLKQEDDLITNTLQKCDEIATSLRKELHLSADSKVYVDRYAGVDPSSARIVSQMDVCAACGLTETDFQLVLKPYQLVGVNFLLLLHRKNVGGAILADEMGLGKTIQAIVYLAVLKYLDKDSGPHLVVCPASLLENWQREFKKWCPSFTVVMYHGNQRASLSQELTYLAKHGKKAQFNVMLVCYSLFERHSPQQKDDRKLLRRFDWSCVLMDEAHLLKDRGSYRRKNLWALAQKARQRLLLTGTPLQNDLQELWSLLEFMVPDIFDSGDCDLKKLLGNKGPGGDALTENMDLISHIKSILGPFVLRRVKTDVMRQLVPKIQKVEVLEMVPDQAATYKEAIDDYRKTALSIKSANDESVSNAVHIIPRRQVNNYFTQFRKIANHPLLIRQIYTEKDVMSLAKLLHPKGAFGYECTLDRVVQELMAYNDFALHRLSTSYGGIGTRGVLPNKFALGSAKCQALSALLPKLKNQGHRPLIFSQWTQMLDILEWVLDTLGFDYCRLDGSTQVTERQSIVDTYNNDLDIFACLLSTRAGGQGLNLTGADTVIIHDMDFNPQMDRQAEDRCHRIGQTKPVTVYRLVTKATVDENIYDIAKKKLSLDAAILESGGETINDEGDARTMGQILAEILSSAPS